MRARCGAGAAAWVAGTLAAPSVQRHELPLPKGIMALSESFFEPLVAGDQKAPVASVSLHL